MILPKVIYNTSTYAGILLVLLMLALSLCSGEIVKDSPAAAKSYDYADSSFITTAEWLSQHRNDSSVVIVDARGESAYDNGHIPGAIASEWQEYADMSGSPDDTGYAELRPTAEIVAILAAKGISPDRTVVVYGDADEAWGEDGHLVWLLRMHGVTSARLLDGGFPFWKDQGYETTREATQPRPVDPWPVEVDSSWGASTQYLAAGLDTLQIVDSRSEREYNGATPYGEARGGHIPGAVHIHFEELYADDGRFLSQDELVALFESEGVAADRTIVAYCTGGVRSGVMAVVLRMAGYAQARNYDGSFWAWAADESLPLE
ncbi:MAG: sulfurtransferase [Chitinivibrionales bacterium]|nr:sulfurtransferase [Chitinivibrionales bacterium]